MGNRALHELEAPSKEDLALAIAVSETFLDLVYELDYKTAALYTRVRRSEEMGTTRKPFGPSDDQDISA